MSLQQVTRRFGATQALDGLTLEARAGEVTCVLGPNGAGKTTAVEIAVGLQRADAGTVRVLGQDPWGADADHRARVGVMLQDGGLPQAVTPTTLLRHLARLWADPVDVAELVDRLELGDAARRPVRRLSGGQRQRVALAAALVGRPEVAFLDEPTAGLDPHARREVHRLVAGIARDGAAVVVTTHSFDEAERLADHVVVVVAGQVAERGGVPDICRRSGTGSLEDAYFVLTDGALR
ncbi:ABC transporter ATP-binding protein [Serinicoccus marinus]|uniref:ABC transporter ATP-binding protein n=1 Tax=Serinicoccus marinus TaxID=247333 RepID=UPI00047FA291|nr:ABC transporter ATP-binding protein [Serinicoccus marinus]